MMVSELIDYLKAQPPSAKVVIRASGNDTYLKMANPPKLRGHDIPFDGLIVEIPS
jgi:hypothetical protein